MTRERAIDWGAQPLGKATDIEVARQLGVAIGVVWRERQKRGIAATNKVAWESIPLGLEPDEAIARALGLAVVTVANQRQRRGIPSFRANPKIDWDAQSLGKVPDVEIARLLGVSSKAVRRARLQRGVAKPPRNRERSRRFDWDAQPLGKETDALVARALGVSKYVVMRERHRRGIAAPPKVKDARRRVWDSALLGCEADCVIAQRLNVSRETVANERRRRGIPAFRPSSQIDWDAQPLGTMPDTSLANQLGVSVFVVLRARQKRGIAAPPKTNRSLAARHQARRRDWDNAPLGCEEDASIAQRMKVAAVTVARQRQRRGIQAFRSQLAVVSDVQQQLGGRPKSKPSSAMRALLRSKHVLLRDVYACSDEDMDPLAARAAMPIDADQLWVDERARCRLLEAFGELTLADLDGSASGYSL